MKLIESDLFTLAGDYCVFTGCEGILKLLLLLYPQQSSCCDEEEAGMKALYSSDE